MSSRNQNNIVDEIKSRCNIVDVVGRIVPLKKAGSNYKGICPFHNEKTPSFVVSETKQIFTCFGCGATGDVIGFVERYYSLDFKGAVEMLAKEYGISLEGAFRTSKDKDESYEINRQAAMFFFRALRERANPGYTYMKNRGISEDTMNRFGIGYADGEWRSLYDHLRQKGISEDKLLSLGLISKSKDRCFDKFRNRVIFPIMNTAGKVIGFGGRIIGEGEPKYLNSQESDVFQKKNNLYGLNLTRKDVSREDVIILVEGYMDVVSLYQAGVRNVSASLGTALTENQARLIKRYTKNVILSYDADQAGQNAAFRGLDILYREGCRARVLKVTDGKDPDEFIKKNGRNAFLELADHAIPYGDFKLNMVKQRYDTSDEQQRVEFIHDAVRVLQDMNPVEADIYIKKLSTEMGISEGAIRFEYSGNTSQESGGSPYDGSRRNDGGYGQSGSYRGESRYGPGDPGAETSPAMSITEQDLIKLMLRDARYMELPADVAGQVFASDAGRSLYRALQQTDRESGHVDYDRLKDFLEEDAETCLEKIRDELDTISDDNAETIFNDCIRSIRAQLLKKEEEEILMRLSMADEEENKEEIIALTQQLMEIQKKRRN